MIEVFFVSLTIHRICKNNNNNNSITVHGWGKKTPN